MLEFLEHAEAAARLDEVRERHRERFGIGLIEEGIDFWIFRIDAQNRVRSGIAAGFCHPMSYPFVVEGGIIPAPMDLARTREITNYFSFHGLPLVDAAILIPEMLSRLDRLSILWMVAVTGSSLREAFRKLGGQFEYINPDLQVVDIETVIGSLQENAIPGFDAEAERHFLRRESPRGIYAQMRRLTAKYSEEAIRQPFSPNKR